MTLGQFESILSFFLKIPSREEFKKNEDQLFSIISKKYGIRKTDFAKMLADKLSNKSWNHGFSQSELVELAHRVNSYPVYLAIARKIKPEIVKTEFPSLMSKIISSEAAEVGTSFTSTANVAAYPVPIGRKLLRRRLPEKD